MLLNNPQGTFTVKQRSIISICLFILASLPAIVSANTYGRQITINGVKLNNYQISNIENRMCGRLPSGNYSINMRTGAWHYKGQKRIRGYFRSKCQHNYGAHFFDTRQFRTVPTFRQFANTPVPHRKYSSNNRQTNSSQEQSGGSGSNNVHRVIKTANEYQHNKKHQGKDKTEKKKHKRTLFSFFRRKKASKKENKHHKKKQENYYSRESHKEAAGDRRR